MRGHLLERLTPAALPTSIQHIARVPLLASGKVDRRSLPSPRRGRRGGSGGDAVRPGTEAALAALWGRLLGVEPSGRDDDFFGLGGTSLLAVELRNRIADELGADVELADLYDTARLSDLASLVDGASAQASARGVRHDVVLDRVATGGDGPPILFVHPGPGAVLDLAPMIRSLADRRTTFVADVAGIAGALGADSVDALADVIGSALRDLVPSGPVAVGGWCFGGVVGYEVANRWTEGGRDLTGLVMVDAGMPRSDDVVLGGLATIDEFLRRLGGDEPSVAGAPLGADEVLARAKAFGALPADSGLAELERWVGIIDRLAESERAWTPRPFTVELTVIAATESDLVDRGPTLGWDVVVDDAEAVPVVADHHGILEEPAVIEVASLLLSRTTA